MNVIDHSSVTLSKGLWLARDLNVEENSYLGIHDTDSVLLEGDAAINGIWEQFHDGSSSSYDCTIEGAMHVGENGTYISHGSTNVFGTVENGGVMALMKPSQFDSNYIGNEGELRLPVVSENNYSGTAACKIPLRIMGISSGNTTVNMVASSDWNTLQTPSLGDNYIVSKKSGDDPAQNTFLLGNEDALEQDLFLKRVNDPGNISGNYMWQVATGITVILIRTAEIQKPHQESYRRIKWLVRLIMFLSQPQSRQNLAADLSAGIQKLMEAVIRLPKQPMSHPACVCMHSGNLDMSALCLWILRSMLVVTDTAE